MNISMNELKAALRRCFEASHYSVGNYEDAANMILWLEKHGLNGLAELAYALPYITDDLDKPLSSVIYEDSTSAIIDSHGRSAFNCIAASVDLAHAKALENGIATVTVHNCHNRMFILKALTDRGRCGISVAAYWQNGSAVVTEHAAAIKAGERYPSYSEAITSIPLVDDKQSLTIICSSRVDLTASLQQSKGNRNARYISAADIAKNKEQTVERGIEIDSEVWAQINKIGTGILVSNNDLSQQGAGGR
ncbi:MAG: LDH2 family malate/lactate/ureidoglycolate dehydrogenase [Motiliproteus sp.]|jgi:LDH2 family malate/lactate/ureidoglycolate dehydrogenase